MIQFLTVFIIAVLVVIDQLIKLAVLKYLEPIGSLTVIPKVIQLSYLENTGASKPHLSKTSTNVKST